MLQQIKIKQLTNTSIVPKYQTAGAACFDLHADLKHSLTLFGSEPQLIKTGIAVEIPEDHVLLIFSRSGHGFNYAVRLANCVGVIDSDYRGELMVKLVTDVGDMGHTPLTIRHGDRIGQAMLVPIPKVELVLVQELGETQRGSGGLGSTGA